MSLSDLHIDFHQIPLLRVTSPMFVYFCAVLISVLFRPLVVFIHELGHAFAALAMSEGRVAVFLGSYGDTKKCFHLKTKRLDIWMKYDHFVWKNGLCRAYSGISPGKQHLFFAAAGPLASLFIGLICLGIAFLLSEDEGWAFIFSVMAFAFVSDFAYNIIPRNRPITLDNGNITYNDGHSLFHHIKQLAASRILEKASKHYNRKEYKEAARLYEEALKEMQFQHMYKHAISAHIQCENYERALQLNSELMKKYYPGFEDYATSAFLKERQGLQRGALRDYNLSLQLKPDYIYALNNRAILYMNTTNYTQAIADFDRVIGYDPTLPDPYAYRGFSKMKLGRMEDGKKDVVKSFFFQPENGPAFAIMGFYYLQKNEYANALQLLEKGKKLAPDFPLTDDWIGQAKNKLA
jgi:tetratricopeptide (TPR) repeat protein